MTEWTQVLAAADAAARWHVADRRKGQAKEPYINHLIEVAHLVGQATAGGDPALVSAAFLHDAIEDQGVPAQEIARLFGADVAALVVEVTDDKSLEKAERKRLQVLNAPKKSARAALLKLADKTSNLRAVAASPAEGWPAERRLAYVAWAREVVAGLKHDNAWLAAEFVHAADAAEAKIRAEA
ncbi:HD domain-containing protein [uncultured Alsobacter sp.]|uniref:HD domain-containing protein n=1 Tax=uncultured Alsobacter sp. TaxID=1748258 RepID=UPI0025FB85DE|nr:HD domain-containing protein [uncultured Alsobacter sp.]